MAHKLAEKRKIKTEGNLRRELERIIEYMYADEERDYCEHRDQDHIFQSLLAVERWLNGG